MGCRPRLSGRAQGCRPTKGRTLPKGRARPSPSALVFGERRPRRKERSSTSAPSSGTTRAQPSR
eukprot:12938508-Alexandrium_andersonii.AAC.1